MKKNVLITGANRGIGLELCRHYSKGGYQVTAVCRSASIELKQLDVKIIKGIDFSKEEAIADLCKQVGDPVDILINNAGIWREENLGAFNSDTIKEQFQVNCLAPLHLSHELLSKIPQGGKIAFVSSRMGSIKDNDSGGRYGYRISKAALNSGAHSLAIDLQPKKVAVIILHPGFVQTDMTGGKGDWGPVEASSALKERIDQLSTKNSGQFIHANGQELPW